MFIVLVLSVDGCVLGRTKLETETAIAGVADAVVYPVSADFSGAAFWALPCGCCLEPLLVSVGDFGQRFLVVVEECFDDVHFSGSFC